MIASPPSDDEFRRSVKDFLLDHAGREGWVRDEFGRTPDDTAPNDVRLARQRRCLSILHEAGFGAISWPTEFGGQGLTNRHQVIFNQEAAHYSLPLSMFIIGHGMCAPTLLAVGTHAQRSKHLPPLLDGTDIWCLLSSEPGAGSDLAAVQCRATRDGDDWVVDGQKVWTSGAHNAAYGLLLARTDPTSSRHAGLSTFIVDMRHPGVDVRPLREMTGAARFNEVFFDGCRLPGDALLGDEGEGWRNAITTLMNERVSIGTSPGGFGHPFRALVAEARRAGKIDDAQLVDRLVQIWVRERILDLLGKRVTESLLAGTEPGPEGSVAKLAGTRLSKDSAALAMEIVGVSSTAWESDTSGGSWAHTQEHSAGLSIAGGTDEIQKNILAERVLGLPRQPRVRTTTSRVATDAGS
jgi:alkylation response protein AidB-like acyl-CoA dehydrogenase